MEIKGAIFDLDGTLLDSMFLWRTIAERYLKSRGLTPLDGVNEKVRNMSLQQAAEYLKAEYGIQEDTQTIMDEVNLMTEYFYMHTVQPKEGVKEFLSHLHSKGIGMCIATATDLHPVEAALIRTGLRQYFKGIYTCSMVGYGKDTSVIYDTALKNLQTPKESTVVFEDALYAMTTAKKAGYPVIAVYDPSETAAREDIIKNSDRFIMSFKEMSESHD